MTSGFTDRNVEEHPYGIAFDGSNIWTTGFSDNIVSGFHIRNGAFLHTFAVGEGPDYILFDGTSLWVSNAGSNTLSKITRTGP